MNQVQNFAFGPVDVRVIEQDGAPWFVGADVLNVLYGRTTGMGNVYVRLAADEVTKVNRSHLTGIPGKPMVLVSESGLYKLVMRSDKPEAKAFQDWVTRVVLPAIRKDGAYVMGEEKVATGELSEDELVMRAMTIMTRKVDRLTQERDQLARDKLWSCTDQVR
ncbi:BRO family protein [Pseudomonas protegens]|uniref:BRO-N domain-containing protein n=1 Tax=Pseudomonas protegens TaxID=380021 RepID=UPI002750E04A|nr:BRO family protein [Pseudomonas protegens]MDP9501567.1 BRO family protein [Pseudomonas protegens]